MWQGADISGLPDCKITKKYGSTKIGPESASAAIAVTVCR